MDRFALASRAAADRGLVRFDNDHEVAIRAFVDTMADDLHTGDLESEPVVYDHVRGAAAAG